MHRRDFLWVIGATALTPSIAGAQQPRRVTVLYDGRTTTLERIARNPSGAANALWIQKTDLPRINGFELKPQGACRADICIPIPKTMVRGAYFDLTAFARKAGQTVVADPAAGGVELRRNPSGARRISRIARRARLYRPGPARPYGSIIGVPREESAARDLGFLVRVPT